ncbi:MAG: hypothetical protein NTW12_15435 [Deltaproteobacteria bacterium]|nr:hypothetical protein [Deltaproteobacteria bacterium]
MSDFKSGKELIDTFDLKPFELFSLVKSGLQPYNHLGNPLPPPNITDKLKNIKGYESELDSLLRRCPQLSNEEFQKRFKSNPREVAWYYEQRQRHQPRIEKLSRDIEDLKNELLQIENKNLWVNYELSEDNSYAQQTINNLLNYYYKLTEATALLKKPETHGSEPTPALPEQTDPETFIRSVSISYLSDTEVSVKIGTKGPKTYSYNDLRFQRENTKAWRALIEILQSSDHLYHVGVAHGAGKARNKTYDANRQKLGEISKKFVSFLNETCKPQLPDDFKIFKIKKDVRPGTYEPKFIVSNRSTEDARYDSYSKDGLITEIEDLSLRKAALEKRGDKDSENKLYQIVDKLNAAIIIAIDKKWLERHRAESYLNPLED